MVSQFNGVVQKIDGNFSTSGLAGVFVKENYGSGKVI